MNKKEYRNEGGGDEGGGKEVKRGGGEEYPLKVNSEVNVCYWSAVHQWLPRATSWRPDNKNKKKKKNSDERPEEGGEWTDTDTHTTSGQRKVREWKNDKMATGSPLQ